MEESIDSSDTNPFRYCGEYYDSEIEQIYLRARYYDPSLGRFTQSDPAMADGMNWYTYCGNNPMNAWDPTGLVITTWDLEHCSNEELEQLERNSQVWINNGSEEEKQNAAQSSRAIRMRHISDDERLLDNGYVEKSYDRPYSGFAAGAGVRVDTRIIFTQTFTENKTLTSLTYVDVKVSTNSGFRVESMQITSGQTGPWSATSTESSYQTTMNYSFSPNWGAVFDDNGVGNTVVGVYVEVNVRRPRGTKAYNLKVYNQEYYQGYINEDGLHEEIDPWDVLEESMSRGER